jgi:NADH:ubiquinone oxidoreductase subunit 3 (subunit A)
MWFVIPGYAIALILTFFVPDIYTAIAFDSGGVASGPMTATFMLQFLIGVCSAAGGNVLTDAFGLVATVAMMPLISIQIIGFIYGRKKPTADAEELEIDDEIIELWG